MNISGGIKSISIVLYLVVLVYASNVPVMVQHKRIESLNTGLTGKYWGISVKFFENSQFYFYFQDTTESRDVYDSVLYLLDTAFSKEIRVSIDYDAHYEITNIDVHYEKTVYHDPKIIPNWKQPSGAHDAYQKGDSVRIGYTYLSTINDNVWSPLEARNYWLNVTDPDFYYIFKKPTGAHNCFNAGTKIHHKDGEVYQSLINGNIWPPDEYPEGWKQLTGKKPTSTDPQPAARFAAPPSATAWTKPQGTGYNYGELVTYKGVTYKSVVPKNIWSPDVARNYWEVVSGTPPILEWNSPKGIFDCYHKGNMVKFQGKMYKSLNNSNIWSPEKFPTGWQEVK